MSGEYPSQLRPSLLRGDTKKQADGIDGKLICETGKLIDYKDKPEIIVTENTQLEK